MSYLTQIILKQGITNPGTVLELAEPAFDTSANLLYVGNGIGNAATLIGPISVDEFASKEYVDGSLGALSGIYTTFEYVDGSLANYATTESVNNAFLTNASLGEVYSKAYIDGSLSSRNVETYTFVTSDTLVPSPTGSNRILGIKNITLTDISVYILGGATIDNLTSKVLLSMNTLDIYDYDATNWYIV